MSMKILKEYEGGCQLLLICPDDVSFGPPPTGPAEPPDKKKKVDLDPPLPEITIDLDLNRRKDISRKKSNYDIPEPVPTDAPMDDIQPLDNSNANKHPIEGTVLFPGLVTEKDSTDETNPDGSEGSIVIPSIFPTASEAHSVSNLIQPSTVPNSVLGPILSSSAIEPALKASTHLVDDIVPPKEIVFGSGVHGASSTNSVRTVQQRPDTWDMIDNVTHKSSKSLGKLATALAIADVVDYVSDYVTDVQDISDVVRAGGAIVDYVADIIPQTKETAKEAAEAAAKQDVIGLGKIALSLTGLPSILSLADKLITKATGLELNSFGTQNDSKTTASYGTSSVSISQKNGGDLVDQILGTGTTNTLGTLVNNVDKIVPTVTKQYSTVKSPSKGLGGAIVDFLGSLW